MCSLFINRLIACSALVQILEHTPDDHADRGPLREALDRAEELCSQVNEGVREKENSDRLEWIQNHVQCEGPIEVNKLRHVTFVLFEV